MVSWVLSLLLFNNTIDGMIGISGGIVIASSNMYVVSIITGVGMITYYWEC